MGYIEAFAPYHEQAQYSLDLQRWGVTLFEVAERFHNRQPTDPRWNDGLALEEAFAKEFGLKPYYGQRGNNVYISLENLTEKEAQIFARGKGTTQEYPGDRGDHFIFYAVGEYEMLSLLLDLFAQRPQTIREFTYHVFGWQNLPPTRTQTGKETASPDDPEIRVSWGSKRSRQGPETDLICWMTELYTWNKVTGKKTKTMVKVEQL